jgi:hypothetical protein
VTNEILDQAPLDDLAFVFDLDRLGRLGIYTATRVRAADCIDLSPNATSDWR